ncbi:MAG: hypothetical protein H6700_07190 [Myxococcales bacterium]|nr:hypothetical protein [Myxococcales bacterium]MCB9520610.1 hypothetical protein [Myxococcales bacterium]MCB9531533.1 hypothetical protein [Myxococcales bacterium]
MTALAHDAAPPTPADICDQLETAGARVRLDSPDLAVVTFGDGPRRRTARLALPAAAERLSGAAADHGQGTLAGFVRGVCAHLSEPDTTEGDTLTFEESASTVVPSLELTAPFCLGLELAGAAPPALHPFSTSLSIAYLVELDDGIRVLTGAQVARWGTTDERLAKAALSILYHRTWGAEEVATAVDGVTALRVGDDNAAARALLLDQLDYARVRRGLLFAVPTSATLLLCDDTSAAGVEAMRRAVASALHAKVGDPLSDAILRYVDGKRDAAPVAHSAGGGG